MEFRIADTFQSSLTKLTAQEQKAVKTAAFDLQMGLRGNSTKFHKIDRARDPNFWSVRANNDIRLIIHKSAASVLLCYVDHHDDAYNWAVRRRIENHPVTGAAQIVEVRELVEDIRIKQPALVDEETQPSQSIFEGLNNNQLLSIGVPEDWLEDILNADEETFLNIAEHLPQEASEILLEVGTGNISFEKAVKLTRTNTEQINETNGNGFAHPAAERRFRIIKDSEELALALDYPWEKWTIFLHPSQKKYVNQTFSGPARISGSAGTGKTIVAIHRAYSLSKKYPKNKILLTTFNKTLANTMELKLRRLVGNDLAALDRIEVKHLENIAYNLFKKVTNKQPNIISNSQLKFFFTKIIEETGIQDFSIGFLMAEWEHIVDAWQLKKWEDYRDIKRLGRKTRIGGSKREKLWEIFNNIWSMIEDQKLTTWSTVFNYLSNKEMKELEFHNIIVDESQDISVGELKFLSGVVKNQNDSLFFTGDLGQRIFRQIFSWKSLGVDIRGRSHSLKINYRTSHQIRKKADRLLPSEILDLDENVENRKSTISLFNSPDPIISLEETIEDENLLIKEWLINQIENGIKLSEIGIFVRSEDELIRAKNIIINSGYKSYKISEKFDFNIDAIHYGVMHLSKGLEYKSVAVMACDENIIPNQERMERVTDTSDLEEVYNTERHLLYVACTRARENLLISGVLPGSEFLEDLS